MEMKRFETDQIFIYEWQMQIENASPFFIQRHAMAFDDSVCSLNALERNKRICDIKHLRKEMEWTEISFT